MGQISLSLKNRLSNFGTITKSPQSLLSGKLLDYYMTLDGRLRLRANTRTLASRIPNTWKGSKSSFPCFILFLL